MIGWRGWHNSKTRKFASNKRHGFNDSTQILLCFWLMLVCQRQIWAGKRDISLWSNVNWIEWLEKCSLRRKKGYKTLWRRLSELQTKKERANEHIFLGWWNFLQVVDCWGWMNWFSILLSTSKYPDLSKLWIWYDIFSNIEHFINYSTVLF